MIHKIINFLDDWEIIESENISILDKNKYTLDKKEHLKSLELEHFEKEAGHLNGVIDFTMKSSIKNKFKKDRVLFGKSRSYLKNYTRPNFDGAC
ncbi:hypothetical protein BKH42_06690 [Helicobacter sp. 13S00482-2]|uniref:hypothetical protein n=1 Tax=Helicobacter sp. 13S00482-2 TaxID=1476200 RepID=UPI000BA69423|nr:hypothetical protein [Helicobacter sp. 13S00482-2]PAF53299.1 hypothetical protein BKH42_06690 [Helicobacter sp. 13S00482-2]